ncbi:MAG TPA: ATP-binding protein, partial [Actinomycetota bacterium]|nr:ATP-binding protein [Actinomycetota bacterium]
VVLSGSATLVALVLHRERELGAISIHLLAVVVGAALGGIWGGLSSSVVGFLLLNYFFTAPRHTLRVANADDVIGLVTFLFVAVIVGSLLARVLAERAHAIRSQRGAQMLSYFAGKVLSGEPLQQVLEDFAGSLLEPLGLARCEIVARGVEETYQVVRTSPDGGSSSEPKGASTALALTVVGADLGTLTAVRKADLASLDGDDRRLLEAAARQIALALERRRLDAQVADARLEAERNRARAALFSSVTHDLRTPLSSIKAGVSSLLHEEAVLDEARRLDLLRTVLEETDRLDRLVGNLLDLAKIRAGALVPAKEPTAVDEVVESVLHRMRSRLVEVRVRTLIREVPEVPADPMQLDQVLTNLLENAVRFSPPGGEVLVSVAPWQDSVQVRVADQGPGIAPEEREHVFEAFVRGGPSAGGGSGLGLAIARAIVLAHGGRIWLEGAPAGGTAAVFELPVRKVDPRAQEPA